MNENWLTPDEVAYRLGVSGRTIRRAIQSGLLPAMRINARVIRIREKDVEDFLRKRSVVHK